MDVRWKCPKCGKLTAGRRPRLAWNKGYYSHRLGKIVYRYDTDFRYPRKHRINGAVCEGSFDEAIRVELES